MIYRNPMFGLWVLPQRHHQVWDLRKYSGTLQRKQTIILSAFKKDKELSAYFNACLLEIKWSIFIESLKNKHNFCPGNFPSRTYPKDMTVAVPKKVTPRTLITVPCIIPKTKEPWKLVMGNLSKTESGGFSRGRSQALARHSRLQT